MRQRSTWSQTNSAPRQAATSRRADPYTMNQDHPQPSVTEYETGNPDTWAETPTKNQSVEGEYEGDSVKRNEIGMGEFRDDTWKHKDSDKWNDGKKYDNSKMAAERKALAAEKVARCILRTANDKLLEEMAIDLMAMPDKTLVATLRRIEAASPDSLPEQSRLRRALACTKLAARTLGDAASEDQVERLASLYMSVDDPTLRSMIKTVASVRVAEDDSKEDKKDGEGQNGPTKSSSEKKEDEPKKDEEKPAAAASEKKDEEPKEKPAAAASLTAEETEMLKDMLAAPPAMPVAPACPPAAPMGMAPAAPMGMPSAPPADDLTAMFDAPAAPAPAGMSMASDITFDEGEDDGAGDVQVASLDDLFADHPEVRAQREIQAAQIGAVAREGGYASARTASAAGAKKLGAVTRTATAAPTVDQQLEALWDRP